MRTCRVTGLLITCFSLAFGQVITSQVDNARTGANTEETTLTPANVNAHEFGKLFTMHVDGAVYAQPLYVPHLAIPGKGTHNVLFVATENDSVYAFDADGSQSEPLWHINFLANSSGSKPVSSEDVNCPFLQPGIGITPTPVIDRQSGMLYVLARSSEGGGIFSSARYSQKLHALAIATGQEKIGGAIEITAAGFDALRELPRAGLLLTNGQIILTWASSCDVKPYHGWVMAYDRRTLKQTAVFNTSPGAGEAGIWQSDTAPAADAQGNIFVATGNGKFTASTGGSDYGDTLLKLAVENGHITVRDYFTPGDQASLNASDQDFGSGGPLLLPDQPGPHPHLAIIGGKSGAFFLLDRDKLGHVQTFPDESVLQVVHPGRDIYAAPAYWNGHLYALASDDSLSDFTLARGHISEHPVKQSVRRFGNPGATPAISANGARDGIVWVIETKAWNDFSDHAAVLHAFNAENIAQELYSSDENRPRDHAGAAERFAIPTVMNGHVYVGAKGEIDVYGLFPVKK